MSKIQLSTSSALKIIDYSNRTGQELLTNVKVLNDDVNSQFRGLNDPVIKKYLELSEELNDSIKIICQKTNDVSDYCKTVINWIEMYKNS